MDDLISRRAAINKFCELLDTTEENPVTCIRQVLDTLPSAQPTLYGYNIEHLKLIANILQKENLPPERVAEALNDFSRIVEIVRVEFSETLRKAVEQCKI